ncbi:uncharacterized protein LOC144666446 isoform X2 [Oculina patagonica]
MAFNRPLLKVISIVQIVMTAVFFVLGMVDRFEARFINTSFLFTPCWISALVLSVGIMGLILANAPRPSSTLINFHGSVSMACAVVCAVTVYHYQWAINFVLASNLLNRRSSSYFVDNDDKKLEFTKQENIMLAVSVLVVVFSLIEIALAVGSAKSSDLRYQPPQENQVSRAYNQFGAGQIPVQPTYIAAQPMVAVPVSSYNVNQ